MPSWVRYSVSVYVGFLLAGSLGSRRPEATGSLDVDSVVEQQESPDPCPLTDSAEEQDHQNGTQPQHHFNFRLSL